MTGQPKKKLGHVQEFADQCFDLVTTAHRIIPPHYLDTSRRPDIRDQIGAAYREVYECGVKLHRASEKLETLLRVKAGVRPHVPRLQSVTRYCPAPDEREDDEREDE